MNYKYIDNNLEMSNLLDKIKSSKLIVLDTEFTRRVTYFPILSIIQIGVIDSNEKIELFIIDAQSDIKLDDFWQIIGDEKITKILHSCRQDLEIFYRLSNIWPQNIIDTQLMANLANLKFNCGYSYLVETICNITLDKEQQNSDWQQRPLAQEQINYALLDVKYLFEIYLSLKDILLKSKKFQWFQQDMSAFIKDVLEFRVDALFKKISFRDRSLREIEILKRLIIYREECAKKFDLPRRRFLKDDALIKMITHEKFPKKLEDTERKNFQKILFSEVDEDKLKSQRLDLKEIAAKKAKHKKLRRLIEKKANQYDIATQILLNSTLLKLIIEDKTAFAKVIHGWRFDIFGKEAQQILEE